MPVAYKPLCGSDSFNEKGTTDGVRQGVLGIWGSMRKIWRVGRRGKWAYEKVVGLSAKGE